MPGTSQFLGQNERDTAHVGLVVRLGQWSICSGDLGGVEGGLLSVASLLGERAAGGALLHGCRPGQLLNSDEFAYRSQLLFSSPITVSSIFCSIFWRPCSRTFPGHPTPT